MARSLEVRACFLVRSLEFHATSTSTEKQYLVTMESSQFDLTGSPFASHFGTNFAPSPHQIVDIRQLLLEPEKKLRLLEEEIAWLLAQRDSLKSFIDNHRSLLSPIRRAPVDVLREIFVECLPKDHIPVRNLKEAPLLLTGICRSWREVAISTPGLWNRIHIALPYPRMPPVTPDFRSLMKLREAGLQLWLGRSGSMPLTLSIHTLMPSETVGVSDARWWSDEEQAEAELRQCYMDFLEKILPYVSRWRELFLNVPSGILKILEDLELKNLNLVEEIRFINKSEESPHGSGHPLDIIFRRSPSLRVLHLEEYAQDFESSIRWDNLTEVKLGLSSAGIGPTEALRILSLSRLSLRRCTLYIQLRANFASDASPIIVMHQLHTLNLSFDSLPAPELSQRFFDAFVAPGLKDFSVVYHGYIIGSSSKNELNMLAFHTFIERSGCAISRLTMDLLSQVAAIALIKLLDLMPSLAELRVGYGIKVLPTISFFDALNSPTNSLCPHLKVFIYEDCNPFHADSLMAFAEARSRTRRLKRMVITFAGSLPDEDMVQGKLQLLRERGMFVQWLSPRERHNQLYDNPMEGVREHWQPSTWDRWKHVPEYMRSY
ncbi:hypothetical protein WG66_001594 [Moniliophthora roreri]|nr:hypothetical protein WG66_001594 [Moniliophthora roreri]